MKAYITGGTGFVGSNIVKLFAEVRSADVHCPVHTIVPEGPVPFTTEPLDLLDSLALARSVAEFGPDVIVHSMILNDFVLMYSDRDLAWRSYVETTRTLAHAANTVGAKLILVSTDWVFDGTQTGADEDTPPNPINYYGVLKLASEQVALTAAERAAVARVSGVNGVHWARPRAPRSQDPGFGYFVASLVNALSAGQKFSVWEAANINMVASPSLASECADVMWRIASDHDADGIFHCCGSESTGRMELAELACDVFELDPRLLRSGRPDPLSMPASPIPYDTSLAVTRTREVLGYEPRPARELLELYREQMEAGSISVAAERGGSR